MGQFKLCETVCPIWHCDSDAADSLVGCRCVRIREDFGEKRAKLERVRASYAAKADSNARGFVNRMKRVSKRSQDCCVGTG